SLRKADTGVSQSSMKEWRSGMRLCSRARVRTSSSDGETAGASAATAIEHPFGVREVQAAAAQQHGEVVEDVGRLLGHPLVRLVRRCAGDLGGLLAHLLADARRVGQQLDRVGAGGPVARPLREHALERAQRLVRGGGLELAAVKARALAGVTSRSGGLDESEQRVGVAVVADRAQGLRVAAGLALVPQLAAR